MCQGSPQGGMRQDSNPALRTSLSGGAGYAQGPNYGASLPSRVPPFRPPGGAGYAQGPNYGMNPNGIVPPPMGIFGGDQQIPGNEPKTGGQYFGGTERPGASQAPQVGLPSWANQNQTGMPTYAPQTGGQGFGQGNAPKPGVGFNPTFSTGGVDPLPPGNSAVSTPNIEQAPGAQGGPSDWNGFNEQTFTGPSGSRQFTWNPGQSGVSADGMLAQIGQLGRGNPSNLQLMFKDAMGKQIGGGGMGRVGNSYLMGLKPGGQYTMEWSGAGPDGFRMGGNPRTWDQTPWIPKSSSGPSFWR